jgi:hypothetical protein
MKKFIKVTSYGGNVRTIRMVNQPEIVDYIKNNPGQSENEIMYEVYDYDRNSTWESNKKYADCLRRALDSGKIRREEVSKNRFIYFINDIPKVEPKKDIVYSSQIKNDNNMNKIKVGKKSVLLNLETEVQVGPLKATLEAMICSCDGQIDIDFSDIDNVTYNGVPISDWRKFRDMNKEFGIDYDKITEAEFNKVFTKEAVKAIIEGLK